MKGALEEYTAEFPLADRAAFLEFCREFYARLAEAKAVSAAAKYMAQSKSSAAQIHGNRLPSSITEKTTPCGLKITM